jgi:hypothetical protein
MNNQRILDIFKQDGFRLMLHFLLHDALTLSLIAFAGLMTIEGLIPGFVSGHLNLAKVLFAITLLFFAFIGIGHTPIVAQAMADKEKSIPSSSGNASKWLLSGLLLWSSLLILNSLIKFPLYAIVIIFILTAIIGKLVYDEFFTK